MLFIDSQQYLRLYGVFKGEALLRLLTSVKDHVFITGQIADEVARNKLGVATRFFTGLFKGLDQEFKAILGGLPDHFFSGPVTRDSGTKLKTIGDGIDRMRRVAKNAVPDLLQQIG